MNAPNRSTFVASWITSHRPWFHGAGDADAIRRAALDPLIRDMNATEPLAEHRGQWGKLIKRDRTPPHVPHDIIVWKDTGEHFDIFTGAEHAEDTQAIWTAHGPIRAIRAGWEWLAVDGATPVPTPEPFPDEDDTPELEALRLRVDHLERTIAHLHRDQRDLLSRVEAIERVAPAEQEYIAESTTSRVWGHAHSFRIFVKPK